MRKQHRHLLQRSPVTLRIGGKIVGTLKETGSLSAAVSQILQAR
jgi:hypothetical protein